MGVALLVSTFPTWQAWGSGGGDGPWVMADLENGLWAGKDRVNPDNAPLP
jgi:hypothetical protein